MKLTLLLLVVFVSTTLASPYYLRGNQPKGPGQGQGAGKGPGDTTSNDVDDKSDGKAACRRARDRCDVQTGDGKEREVSTEADKASDVADCEGWLENELKEATEGRKRDADTDDLAKQIDKCKEQIEECAKPDHGNIERLLHRLLPDGPEEDDACETVEKKLEDMESESTGDKTDVTVKEMRNLLRRLYDLK